MMKKNGFSRCAEMYIGRLRKEGRYSTAHVYENALLSFCLLYTSDAAAKLEV